MTANAAQPLTILLIEDNRDARTTLRMLLTLAHGHTVLEAGDGLRGIQLAIEARPDAALIDLGLPGLDGYEVARRIREHHPRGQMLLVALTGYGTHDDRAKAEAAGFDLHLVKPIGSDALARALARVQPTA